MVTSMGPIDYAAKAQPIENEADRTSRSIAEARRLIAQNQIAGAKAMRILAMLSTAEQNMGEGRTVEAQRIAREALKQAKDASDETNAALLNQTAAAANPQNALEETPAAKAQGASAKEPFQRKTTNYADGSSDAGVSFQSATPLTPGQAPFAVMQHELSHVRRETSDAILNGQRIMASVTIHSRVDPVTGDRQVGGGQARILIFPNVESPQPASGKNLDIKA
ncbi:MAG: hypothetical protein AB1656_03540 [Candidatus Omnitrophota bacterium]